jgi:hypothetical protein
MAKQINKVNKKECMDAIDYFFSMGMLDNGMRSDERYYCRILLNKVANDYRMELKWDDYE